MMQHLFHNSELSIDLNSAGEVFIKVKDGAEALVSPAGDRLIVTANVGLVLPSLRNGLRAFEVVNARLASRG